MLGTAEKLVRLFVLWVVARFRGEVASLELLSHTNEHRGLVPDGILVNVNTARNEDVHGLVDGHTHRYALNARALGVWGWSSNNGRSGWAGRWQRLPDWTNDGLIAQRDLRLPLVVVPAFDAHTAELNQLAVKRSKIAAKASGQGFYTTLGQRRLVEDFAGFRVHRFTVAHIGQKGAGEKTTGCCVHYVFECLIHCFLGSGFLRKSCEKSFSVAGL